MTCGSKGGDYTKCQSLPFGSDLNSFEITSNAFVFRFEVSAEVFRTRLKFVEVRVRYSDGALTSPGTAFIDLEQDVRIAADVVVHRGASTHPHPSIQSRLGEEDAVSGTCNVH